MKPVNLDDYISVVPTHIRFDNLEGKTFHRLNVVRLLGKRKNDPLQRLIWDCECICGNRTAVDGGNLKAGRIKSCGCYQDESRILTHRTHGRSKTPEYVSYHEARKRCNNPKVIRYPQYGGRGIEFRFTSFEHFFSVLGPKPDTEASLDRIDVDGHYEPTNVRWANRMEQQQNTRNNHRITLNDITKTMAEWSRESGIDCRLIDARIRKLGWCESCAVQLKKPDVCAHRAALK